METLVPWGATLTPGALGSALRSQAPNRLQAASAPPWLAAVRAFWETQSYDEENLATRFDAGKPKHEKEKAGIVFAVLLCCSKILQITKILGFNCCRRTDIQLLSLLGHLLLGE